MSNQVLKNNQSKKWKITIRSLLVAMVLSLVFTSVSFAGGGRYKSDEAWSFGVNGDTQWTISSSTNPKDPYENPNPQYVSAAAANAINMEYIDKGVKFAIQVGDLTDRAGDAAMYARADAAQPLYDAGIGFFPLRGNHETYGSLYGRDPNHNLNIPAYLDAFPQTQGLANTFGATNFSSPSDVMSDVDELDGLSYSFDYGNTGSNARFMIVDVEQSYVDGKEAPNNPPECVAAIAPGTPEGIEPYCGQGYLYFLNDWFPGYDTGFVVYQATHEITNGVTTIYDSAANPALVDEPITIAVGEWFRIDSLGRPSTDWHTWNEENPDQEYPPGTPFDIVCPVASPSNRELSTYSASGTEFWPGDQQDWISAQLDKTTRGTEHAFVFSHRPLMGANHADGFFGSNPGSKSSSQNVFYASLMNNDVKYMISGHDHIYNRALVASPNGLSQVEQLISIGASSKFYEPNSIDSFTSYYGPVKQRETQISQEFNNIGFYIYTVDGPRVTVDYYSDAIGDFMSGMDYLYAPVSIVDKKTNLTIWLPVYPDFDFVKKETWGYSLNGDQTLVAQGETYAGIGGSFEGTTATIIEGTNNSTTTDATPYDYDDEGNPYNGPRPLNKTVNTGWTAKPDDPMLASNIFSLWGLGELGKAETDVYVLQMSYDESYEGDLRLASIRENGKWAKAYQLNEGHQTPKFVMGPYDGQLELGRYGIDVENHVVWAVINYDADFAVVKFE